MEISPLISAVLSFLFVLGLLLGTLWFVRSRGIGMGSTMGHGLRVVSSLRLGPKHRLDVVEYSGRRLLLGISPNDITLLDAQAQKGASDQEAASFESDDSDQLASGGFAGQLREFMQRDR